eukprot:TRINITY_DN3632_c2_g1_i1.p1 TRINITY_DN3632_c2_g1~~TRINITY_DN3632_c2_g1_i1.p1  ORF type:complete len:876 (+),score=213.91 TRINITY_DN3632_c2_g1_i1:35-2662(+)
MAHTAMAVNTQRDRCTPPVSRIRRITANDRRDRRTLARRQKALATSALAALCGYCYWQVTAPDLNFARPKGFGAATQKKPETMQPVEVEVLDTVAVPAKELEEQPLRHAPAQTALPVERPPGVDVVIAGGGVAGLWLAILLGAGMLQRKVARVRLFEPRWRKSTDGQLYWREERLQEAERLEVATVDGSIWSKLSAELQPLIFPPGHFAEQWPKQGAEASTPFPRNVVVGDLEDRLLEVAQTLDLELLPHAYDASEHSQLLSIQDPFKCVVFADGASAPKACEQILEGGFGNPVPRRAATAAPVVDQEATVAVAFDMRELSSSDAGAVLLGVGASAAISLAQRRYFLAWSAPGRGLLHMRLTHEESRAMAELRFAAGGSVCPAELIKQLRDSQRAGQEQLRGLWQDIREGCRLYRIPDDCLSGAACFTSDAVDWPNYTRYLADTKGPLVAFLIGTSARASSAEFGPGFGAGAALEGASSLAEALLADSAALYPEYVDTKATNRHEVNMRKIRSRERQPVILGLGECITAGLKGGIPEAKETVLSRLESSLASLLEEPEHLPEAVRADLPSWEVLREHILSAELSPRAFAAMAAAGPRPKEEQAKEDTDTQQAREAAFDCGGETPEGLALAARLEQAAEAGDKEARFELGVIHFTAKGVAKDEAAAFRHLHQAAELGHRAAQNCVGTMLRNGLGTSVQKEEAAIWFQKAADAGDTEAIFNLGDMLYEGEVEKNEVRGVQLFEKAALQGLDFAQFKLGMALREGIGIDMDQSLGTKWVQQSAKHGLPQAMQVLGSWLYIGDGVVQDKAEAARYFQKAADQGDALAQYSLGVMYELGDGVTKSDAQAQHYLRQAAAQGLVEAQARCREQGLLAPPRTS